MSLTKLSIQCHCRALTLETRSMPATVTCCNCSICNRLGAQWAYFKKPQVRLIFTHAISAYCWGKQHITFFSCTRCHCTTHYQSTLADGSERIALNMRMANTDVGSSIQKRYYDGAQTGTYLFE